ncbi:MAG: hypothetical protein ACRCS9_10460 [Hyphomicrobium sp.]
MNLVMRMAAAAAVLGSVSVASAWSETAPAPGTAESPVVMIPGQGLPLDVGGKRIVGVFQREHQACGLTIVLAVADAGGMAAGERDGPHGTRITLELAPGKTLQIDGDMNRTAAFMCGPGGRKMNARVYTRDGYKAAQKGAKS